MKKLLLILLVLFTLQLQAQNIFHYSKKTNEYLGASIAREDPREPGRYLIPANATTVTPYIDVPDNKINVWDGEKWELKDDLRGTTYFSKSDGSKGVIKEIGELIPDTCITLQPIDIEYPKWNGDKWVEKYPDFKGFKIKNKKVLNNIILQSYNDYNAMNAIIDYLIAIQNGQNVPKSWNDFIKERDKILAEIEVFNKNNPSIKG